MTPERRLGKRRFDARLMRRPIHSTTSRPVGRRLGQLSGVLVLAGRTGETAVVRVARRKEPRGLERWGWMKLIVAACVVVLVAGAWKRTTASVGPTCSASATRNEQTLRERHYARYCGRGRAVVRVDGKMFVIKGGTCHRRGGGVGFGLIEDGGRRARGIWLRLQPVGDALFVNVVAGRNKVIDGEVQLPGFPSLPHTGTAIVAKDLRSGTFSLGSPAKPRITGSFTCA
jgi:hypothetical protein